MSAGVTPLVAVRNLGAKAWRRAAAVPKRGVRLVRRAERLRQQADAFRAEWQIERELARVARGREPVIVGPWLSEVGFEVLYWVPFVRWFADRYRVDRDRIVAVSRGGVRDWYADVAGSYVDIFDYLEPATFSRRNAERREHEESGGQKQTTLGTLDRELVEAARRSTGIRRATLCHPSFMYRLFNRFWFGNRAADLVTSHTRYVPLTAPPSNLSLPERYVAAKFYTGAALPDTPDCRTALRGIIRQISARTPVVLLDTGIATDEHEDYLFRDCPNVTSLREHLEPRSNLGVQTSVIAGAQAFIGTCGSLAWLAPLLGVNTIAVHADERFLLSHIAFASNVYRQVGAARFDTFDLRAAAQLDLLDFARTAEAARP